MSLPLQIIATGTNRQLPIITYTKATAAQLKNLVGSPLVLIPAQGTNTVIVPKSFAARFSYGGTSPFTGPGLLAVKYNNFMSSSIFPTIMSNAVMTGTADAFSISGYLQTSNENLASGLINNTSVVLWNPINNFGGNAANDNVLYIQICYWVATLQ